MTKLFLDDLRSVSDIYQDDDWIIARSFDEAVEYVSSHGIPNEISFDNDLGSEKEGYDFAKWLVDQCLDGTLKFPENFKWWVHSANCLAWNNIDSYLKNYLKSVKNGDVQ
jgi:hypothetical protein